jgi:hypothetical protein
MKEIYKLDKTTYGFYWLYEKTFWGNWKHISSFDDYDIAVNAVEDLMNNPVRVWTR